MMNKILRYLQLRADADLPDLKLAPFIAIVLVEDEVQESWMWDASRWLVASGCRYALAWGRDCEAWRDAIDDAYLESVDYEDVPAERKVMSTWHEDEDLEEVFWFAKHRAAHSALQLDTTLILHIAPSARKDEIEAQYADA